MSETLLIVLFIILGNVIIFIAAILAAKHYLDHIKDLEKLIKSNSLDEYTDHKVIEHNLEHSEEAEEEVKKDEDTYVDLQNMSFEDFEKRVNNNNG